MRPRSARSLPIVVLILAFAACKSAPRAPASEFNVADRARQRQLLSGFYDVETQPNRWAAREFTVALRPPPGSEQSGAVLRLRFFVPGYQLDRIGPMTLHAEVDGWSTEPRTFSEGGFFDYTAEVPACVLAASMVPVKFSFDKASLDGRELGAVVADVGLRAAR